MRVRKATIAGVGVDPNVLAPPARAVETGAATPQSTAYEVAFSLADLRSDFFRAYTDWLADMREYPDPEDELEAQLRALRWPSLGVLAEVDAETFAVVLLAMGRELLTDLEHGRDPMVPVRWALTSVEEVELKGRRIVLRGSALAVRPRGRDSSIN
jgi:hypothetical protein